MKTTGMIRRFDANGSIAIPKHIRRMLSICEGDPYEITTGESGELILKRHALLEQARFLSEFACTLSDNTGMAVAICSTETVVETCGDECEEYHWEAISLELREAMENEELDGFEGIIAYTQDEAYGEQIIAPIYSGERVIGCVAAVKCEEDDYSIDTAQSYVEMIAGLIGRMEDWCDEF